MTATVSKRVLVTGDPVRVMQPQYDTSLLLMQEALLRGYAVDYLELKDMDAGVAAKEYLNQLCVREVLYSAPEDANFIGLAPRRKSNIQDYCLILNRKDPPVDDFFSSHARVFSHAPKSILQINDPLASISVNEHELPLEFPWASIPTRKCANLSQLQNAVQEFRESEVVLKPANTASGVGIEFVDPSKVSDKYLQDYLNRFSPCYVQPFRMEITKSGDLRILVFNERIIGSVLRVPRQGSRLANLHQGATGRAFEPTSTQISIVNKIAPELHKRGLLLLGFDFIGNELSELNITSPSALSQINEVMGIRGQTMIWDEIEVLFQNRSHK